MKPLIFAGLILAAAPCAAKQPPASLFETRNSAVTVDPTRLNGKPTPMVTYRTYLIDRLQSKIWVCAVRALPEVGQFGASECVLLDWGVYVTNATPTGLADAEIVPGYVPPPPMTSFNNASGWNITPDNVPVWIVDKKMGTLQLCDLGFPANMHCTAPIPHQ